MLNDFQVVLVLSPQLRSQFRLLSKVVVKPESQGLPLFLSSEWYSSDVAIMSFSQLTFLRYRSRLSFSLSIASLYNSSKLPCEYLDAIADGQNRKKKLLLVYHHSLSMIVLELLDSELMPDQMSWVEEHQLTWASARRYHYNIVLYMGHT